GDGGDHYLEWGLNEYDDADPEYMTIFDAYAGDVTPAPDAGTPDAGTMLPISNRTVSCLMG
ncbi:MAG: hypothetical protein ACYSW7_05070, partial [Planctomycetota bacterium]